MESDRESPPATSPRITRADPGLLYDAWRRRALAGGWLTAEDWDSDAVAAVVAAACGTGALLPQACEGLGRSRARAGLDIAGTIDDLAALFAVLEPGEAAGPGEAARPGEPAGLDWLMAMDGPGQGGAPPLALVCAAAEGWAEEGMAQLSRGGCEDPLSGLATVPYLRTRLAELYREAAQGGASPADTHRLLLVSLPGRPDPWRRMALAILVGHDLRAAFPGGETLSLARHSGATDTGLAIALVRVRDDLPMRYARLRRTARDNPGTEIWMTRLPARLPAALHLVDELAP